MLNLLMAYLVLGLAVLAIIALCGAPIRYAIDQMLKTQFGVDHRRLVVYAAAIYMVLTWPRFVPVAWRSVRELIRS